LGKTKILGFALTFVFLGLVLWKTDLNELGQALRSANYLYVAPAVLCTFTSYVLRAFRWRRILAPTKRIPFGELFPVLMIGFMANNVLPARLGEFVRAYQLGRKENISKTLSFATIMLERLLDGIILVLILALLSLALPLPGWGAEIAYLASAVFLAAAVGVIAILLREDLARRIIHLVMQPLPSRLAGLVAEKAGAFILGLHALRRKRAVLALLAVSVVIWCVEMSSYLLVLSGFGPVLKPNAPVLAAFLTLVVVNLGIMIPSGPGYVGTFQAFAILALGYFGVQHELALGIAIVAHSVQYILVTGLGLVFFWHEHMSFRAIQRVESGDAESEEASPETASVGIESVDADVVKDASMEEVR
jgi:uncharacterized protein (TIRG00374 family)